MSTSSLATVFADGAVTSQKLADGSVTDRKVAPGGLTPAVRDSRFLRGINYTSSSPTGMVSAGGLANIATAAANGIERLSIIPVWYMASSTATAVAEDITQSATDATVIAAAAYARQLGMRVMLKPHVNVADASWRGNIAPSDLPTWFASYTTFIAHWAALAETIGAELFSVGCEFQSLTVSGNDTAWRAVIAAVRAVYSGSLTYSANQTSEALQVGWWDALDYAGVDNYEALTAPGTANPGVAALVLAWQTSGLTERLARVYRRAEKPVILTEIGYYSRTDTAGAPSVVSAGATSAQAQADAMDAALQVLGRQSFIKGVYWWALDPQGSPALGNYAFVPTTLEPIAVLKRHGKAGALGDHAATQPPVAAVKLGHSADVGASSGAAQILGADSPFGSYWDTQTYNTDNMWSSSSRSRIYCRTPGLYMVGGAWSWAGNATGAVRYVVIWLNGTEIVSDKRFPNSTNSMRSQLTTCIRLVAGDYLQMVVQQDSGGALVGTHLATSTPSFWATRIGP